MCDVCSRFGSVFCLYVSSECRAEGWIDKYGAAEWVVYMPGTSLPNYSDKQKYVRLFCSKPNRLRLFLFAPKPTLCSSLSGSLLSLPISVSSTFGSTTDARIIDKRIYVVWAKSQISSAFPCDVTINVYSYNLLYIGISSVCIICICFHCDDRKTTASFCMIYHSTCMIFLTGAPLHCNRPWGVMMMICCSAVAIAPSRLLFSHLFSQNLHVRDADVY